MKQLFAGIPLLLLSLPVLADETVVSVAPQVEADPTVLIVFALVFVGLIGTYAYIIWKADQKKKGAAK